MERNFDNTKITVEFDEAGNRQQISSGDSLKTLFGKIKKWFSDLKPVAFTGSYSDLEPKLLIHEDLNDLKLDNLGIYYGGSGNDCKNLPDNVIGFSLHVLRSAYSSVMQVLYANEEPFNVWFRVYREYKSGEGNTWGEWNFAYNSDGQKTVCDVPTGFDHRDNDLAWGTQEGEYITAWNAGNNCSVGFRKNCPTNGKASIILDGTVYVDEGKYPVVSHDEYDTINEIVRVGNNCSDKNLCISNPWYKVAELNVTQGNYDENMTLLVSSEFYNPSYSYWGIMRVEVRVANNGVFSRGNLEWGFLSNKVDENEWVLLYDNNTPCKCEIWTKLPERWRNISIRKLSSSTTRKFECKWKLLNSYYTGTAGSESYTNGMTVIKQTYMDKFINGNICYQGTNRTGDIIKFIDNTSDTSGNGISIGDGGLTIIGGGESSNVIAEQYDSNHMEDGEMHGGDEKMIIANDTAIDFYTDCQNGFDTAKHITMSNGKITADKFFARNENAWCMSENTINYPYHRFAYIEPESRKEYLDSGNIFIINRPYYSNVGGMGIFQVFIRKNHTVDISKFDIRWIVRDKNIPIDCIKMCCNSDANNTTVDLFYQFTDGYNGCVISRISDWGRRCVDEIPLKLCNSHESGNTTATDKKDSYESYKSLDDAATELGRTFTDILTPRSNSFIQESWFANKLCSEYIPKNSDLNTYVESGIYYNNLNAETKTLANCPTQNAFVMFVKQYGELDTGTQEITEYLVSNPKRYMRNFYNGTWGQWYRVYTTADPPTASNVDWSNVQNKPTIPTAIRVKGNAESAYRTGDVNLTSDNIGALNKFGDTMNGNIIMAMNKGITFKNQSNDGIWFNNGSIATSSGTSYTSDMTIKTKYFYVYSDNASFYNKEGTSKGNIYANLITSSSRRVKENIHNMTADEAIKILDINVVGFDYINGDKNQYGMIAEEVNEIIPNMVSGDVQCNDNDTEAIKHIGIDYSKAVPYLIKMVQMMDGEIKELKEKLKIRDKIDE